jgi:hypothetical protein
MSDSPSQTGAARWKGAVRPVMMVLAIGFMIWTGVDLANHWESKAIHIDTVWLGVAMLPPLFALWLQATAWVILIEHLSGRRVPRRAAFALYYDSQFARYTPGKVGLPAVRLAGADKIGVSARAVGASILVEMLSWLASGGVVGSLLLVLGPPVSEGLLHVFAQFATVLLGLAVVGMVALALVDRSKLPKRLNEVLSLDGKGPLVPLSVPLLQGGHWLAWGAHGVFLAVALGASWSAALAGAGAVCLGIVLGFVALFAPAGAGVREAVMAASAAPVLGAPAAIALGILARAGSLVGDVIAWLVARAALRFWRV